MPAGFLRLEAALIDLSPLGMFIAPRRRPVRRRERREVFEVHRNSTDHDANAGAATGLEDVREVALKMLIDHRHPRVVGTDAVFEEHPHPAPLALCGGGSVELP